MYTLLIALESNRPLSDALLQVFGRAHPLLVHFPIALLLVAALFELAHVVRGGAVQRRAVDLCLHLGALGAVVSAVSGWLYTDFEGVLNDLVELHRWTGVAAASLAVLASALSFAARSRDAGPLVVVYRLVLIAVVGAVGFTGHLGGQMAWGQDYLFEPLHEQAIVAPPAGPRPDAVPAAVASGRVSYSRDVAPLIAAHCFDCHGPTGRAKADLRLGDLAAAVASFYSSEFGALVAPGNSGGSALHAVLVLPRDHDLAMPPPGDHAAVSADEADLIARWIDSGATLAELFDESASVGAAPRLAEPPVGVVLPFGGAQRAVPSDVPLTAIGVAPAVLVPAPSAPIKKSSSDAPLLSDFAAVREVFATHCYDCHGPDVARPKKGLRVDDPAAFVRGDDHSAWLVVPGDSAASELVALITKSEGEKGRMPPKGAPLSADEVAVVRAWIDGAPTREALLLAATDSAAPKALAAASTAVPTAASTAVPTAVPVVVSIDLDADPYEHLRAADSAALEAARASGGEIAPLGATTKGLEAVFRFRPSTSDGDLAALEAIAGQLVALDLARTAVGDVGLGAVARLAELRRLHLEGTRVTDAGLAALGALYHLEYLNLTQTAITDLGLAALDGLPSGCKVYLWGSSTTDAGRAALAQRRPDLVLP